MVIGRNKYFCWLKIKGDKHRIVVESHGYALSYARQVLKTMLNFFVDVDAIEQGRRRTIEIPDEILQTALGLRETIEGYRLSSFPKFREEFNKIAFNSLSQDHTLVIFVAPVVTRNGSFNSLSRDHGITDAALENTFAIFA